MLLFLKKECPSSPSCSNDLRSLIFSFVQSLKILRTHALRDCQKDVCVACYSCLKLVKILLVKIDWYEYVFWPYSDRIALRQTPFIHIRLIARCMEDDSYQLKSVLESI